MAREMGFLAMSSSIAIFIAGLAIMVCWSIASGDDMFIYGHCGGCIRLLHKLVWESDQPQDYYRSAKDPFPLLLTFGVLCGVLWIVTSIAVVARPRYYLISGLLTTIIFICSFVPLVERMRRNQTCTLYADLTGTDIVTAWNAACRGDGHWQLKHMYDSFEVFWGSSAGCFLAAAYQVGCGIAMTYEDETRAKGKADGETHKPLRSEDGKSVEEKAEEAKKPEAGEESKLSAAQDASVHEPLKDASVAGREVPEDTVRAREESEKPPEGSEKAHECAKNLGEEERKEEGVSTPPAKSEVPANESMSQQPPEGSPVPEVDMPDFSLSND